MSFSRNENPKTYDWICIVRIRLNTSHKLFNSCFIRWWWRTHAWQFFKQWENESFCLLIEQNVVDCCFDESLIVFQKYVATWKRFEKILSSDISLKKHANRFVEIDRKSDRWRYFERFFVWIQDFIGHLIGGNFISSSSETQLIDMMICAVNITKSWGSLLIRNHCNIVSYLFSSWPVVETMELNLDVYMHKLLKQI